MSSARSVPTSVRLAKTDLYDTNRRTFYIQYPAWFVVVLAMAGVVAFAVTGFLGYPKGPIHSAADNAFTSPWVLYLWLSALLITLVASVLRDASLRARLFAMVVVSLVAVAFIGLTRFQGVLPDFLKNLLGQHVIFQYLSTTPATYTVINFGLIGIFWADTIRRWVRYSRGVPLYPRVDIGLPESERGGDPRKDLTFSELISGDLLAGSLLAILLFGIFRVEVIGAFIHPQGASITTCTLSWPFGSCAQGATITDPPTIAFMDLLQSLFYLPLGLIILALSAMLSGLGAVHAVDNLDLALASTSISSQSSTAPITEDVTLTLFKALRSAIGRRGRNLAGSFVLSLRWVGWPALLVLGTFGISEVSVDVQTYLHSQKTISDAATWILPAAGWGLAAIISIVVSIALMLFRFRVVENTLRFLGLIGLVALLTFWIFSLALWGVNQLIYQFNVEGRAPFDPPGASTLLSLAALLLFGILLLINNARRGSARRPQPAVATASATTAAEQPQQSGRRVIEQPYGPPIVIEEPTAPVLAQTMNTNPPASSTHDAPSA